jgi:hypothetical protein
MIRKTLLLTLFCSFLFPIFNAFATPFHFTISNELKKPISIYFFGIGSQNEAIPCKPSQVELKKFEDYSLIAECNVVGGNNGVAYVSIDNDGIHRAQHVSAVFPMDEKIACSVVRKNKTRVALKCEYQLLPA